VAAENIDEGSEQSSAALETTLQAPAQILDSFLNSGSGLPPTLVSTSTLETVSADTLEDGWQYVRGRSWNKRLIRLCVWGADTKPLKG